MKDCRACKAPKEEREFSRCAASKDGLQSTCKPCCAAYHRRKYYGDLDAARKKSRESARRQREKNPEKIRARQSRYRDNPEVREKARRASREFRLEHPEHYRNYRKRFPEAAENTRLKSRYGITLEQRNAMHAEQKGRCAGCNEVKKLDVDHNHTTGRVRGLLCRHCNTALGLLKESPSVVRTLLAYIERHI